MNKFLLALLCLLPAALPVWGQQGAAKLSPLTRLYLQKTATQSDPETPLAGYVYKQNAARQLYISALIQAGSNIDNEQLKRTGAVVGTRAGNIWTVQIPLTAVTAFTQVHGIEYIQLDEPVFPLMDSVRKVTRVDSVHGGFNLPAAFSGKNVVMGILDVGFDYTNPLFYDTLGQHYRVRKIWEQKTLTGTPPPGYLYGREITDSNAMQAAGTDIITQSHGTHVAGIAAGSGIGSNTANRKFRGVAYGTDLVLVGITPPAGQWQNTGMSDIIDGMDYVYKYAALAGKPAVVNLSWGCTVGPHDGLSLFSKACDNLTGTGKLFICSAGNTGNIAIHLGKTFTATDTLVQTFVNFSPDLSTRKTWLDIWGDSSRTFCAKVTLYNGSVAGNTTGFICLDNTMHNTYITGASGDTCFIDVTTSTSEFNGKPRIFLNIYNKGRDAVLLSIIAGAGRINAWNGYVENSSGYYGTLSNGGLSWAANGDANMTISDWSATRSAIPVGAFAAKNVFDNVSGGNVSYISYVGRGRIVPFSSRGPSADGRIRPFIAAPGFCVGSAINSYDASFLTGGGNYDAVVSTYNQNGRTYSYAMLSGTSMSSPVVAGIAALLLEANPALTPVQAQDVLAVTAMQDALTGVLPATGTNIWGHGKVNAYAAVARTLQQVSVGNVIARNLKWSLYPNPGNGRYAIECTTDKSESGTIEITDVTGKIIYRSTWLLNAGTNKTAVDISHVAKGIYYTKLTTRRGAATMKVVVE